MSSDLTWILFVFKHTMHFFKVDNVFQASFKRAIQNRISLPNPILMALAFLIWSQVCFFIFFFFSSTFCLVGFGFVRQGLTVTLQPWLAQRLLCGDGWLKFTMFLLSLRLLSYALEFIKSS